VAYAIEVETANAAPKTSNFENILIIPPEKVPLSRVELNALRHAAKNRPLRL
jgi:hypothetical protein